MGPQDGLMLQLAGGGGSDIATLAPIQESPSPTGGAISGSSSAGSRSAPGGQGTAGGVRFAPIGLTNLLNAGGAVTRWEWMQEGWPCLMQAARALLGCNCRQQLARCCSSVS
jgi:hypothetical protein